MYRIMAPPRRKPSGTRDIAMRLDADLVDQVDAEAGPRGRTAAVEEALRLWLEQRSRDRGRRDDAER